MTLAATKHFHLFALAIYDLCSPKRNEYQSQISPSDLLSAAFSSRRIGLLPIIRWASSTLLFLPSQTRTYGSASVQSPLLAPVVDLHGSHNWRFFPSSQPGALIPHTTYYSILQAAALVVEHAEPEHQHTRSVNPSIIRISRSLVGASGGRLRSAVTAYTGNPKRGHVLVAVALTKPRRWRGKSRPCDTFRHCQREIKPEEGVWRRPLI